ncbi:hypothetical protein [Streptantibioticus ferralitis]|uniref:hypothetical protein n=1 Tax=Streptantibioticus ferralitis TaxID=236510 RepID=UPI0027E3358A|nr:hypothetical protein [Streptantibioticus ferralitis]
MREDILWRRRWWPEPGQRRRVVDHPVLARLLVVQVLQDQGPFVWIGAEEHRHHGRAEVGRELQRGHLAGIPLPGFRAVDELFDHHGSTGQLRPPYP